MDRALEYYVKAETFYLYFDRAANAEARRLYQLAVDEERKKAKPEFARPFSDLAYSILHAWLFNWDSSATLEMANDLTMEALDIADNDYYSRWMRAAIRLYQREFADADSGYEEAMALAADQAIPEEQRALRVDWGDYLLLSGQAEQGVSAVEQAIAESPVPEKWFFWVHAWALYETDQFQASIDALHRLRSPRNAMRKNLIADYVALGDVASGQGQSTDAANYYGLARTLAARFLEEEAAQGTTYAPPGQLVWPGLSEIENRIPFKDPSRLARWKGHLERAFEGLVQPPLPG